MRALFLFLFLYASQSMAEYRVFQLRIGPRNSPNFRLVLSNLDPEQYVRYYPVPNNQVVEYIDTWMCKGSTEKFKPFCENPRAPASTKPSSGPS